MKTEIKIKDSGIFYGIGPEDDAFPSIPLRAVYRNDKGQLLIAYWLPWHPQEIIREARIDLSLADRFEKPVRVDLISGKVYSVEYHDGGDQTTVLTGIPLADYPMVIVERDAIDMRAR